MVEEFLAERAVLQPSCGTDSNSENSTAAGETRQHMYTVAAAATLLHTTRSRVKKRARLVRFLCIDDEDIVTARGRDRVYEVARKYRITGAMSTRTTRATLLSEYALSMMQQLTGRPDRAKWYDHLPPEQELVLLEVLASFASPRAYGELAKQRTPDERARVDAAFESVFGPPEVFTANPPPVAPSVATDPVLCAELLQHIGRVEGVLPRSYVDQAPVLDPLETPYHPVPEVVPPAAERPPKRAPLTTVSF